MRLKKWWKKQQPPKWRLSPTDTEKWYLEKWHTTCGVYLIEAIVGNEEEADRKIALLDRDKIYYREEKENL